MEIKRKTSKSGRIIRILKESSAYEMYVIEYAQIICGEDCEVFIAWHPICEPQKVFTSLKECEERFNHFLQF